MTIRKVYFGSRGPFLYDDTDLINDADGDFAGMYYSGVVAEQMIVTEAPTDPSHVARLSDLSGGSINYSFRYAFMMGI